MKKRGLMAFVGGITWSGLWVVAVIGVIALLDVLIPGGPNIPPFMAKATAFTALAATVWFWNLGFWRAWSRQAVTHDGKWSYCGDARPCGCGLPKVCLEQECSCEKLHACADPQCGCPKPKVCASEKCRCDLPKAFTFRGKSTWK